MNAKIRNRWYFKCLCKYDCIRMYLTTQSDWFAIPQEIQELIGELAEVWNVKPQTNEWTTGHTLYNRAIKGRPF